MSTSPRGRVEAAWACCTSNAGAARIPFGRVIAPDRQESSRPMRTSAGALRRASRSSTRGMRVSPRRSSPSFACPE